jgi:hypothetical protein
VTAGGLIVSSDETWSPFSAAEIVATVCAATEVVLTVNVAELFPAAIVTDTGTTAAVELVVSATTMPPVAAGPDSVIVPTDAVRPVTVAGLSVTDSSEGGWIVSVAA